MWRKSTGKVRGCSGFFPGFRCPICAVLRSALFCVALPSESLSSMGREGGSQKSQVFMLLQAHSTHGPPEAFWLARLGCLGPTTESSGIANEREGRNHLGRAKHQRRNEKRKQEKQDGEKLRGKKKGRIKGKKKYWGAILQPSTPSSGIPARSRCYFLESFFPSPC